MMRDIFQCAGGKLFRAVLCFFFFFLDVPAFGQAGEMLVVFTGSPASAVDRHFREQLLPGIVKVAKGLQVPVEVADRRRGLPSEVGITPLVVYQNHLGRSVYQGRTTTFNRVKNFIRTSRRIPQGKEGYVLKETAIWRVGRSAVWAPLKITPLTGTLPADHDPERFLKEAGKSVGQGFEWFQVEKETLVGRSDRGFYMDIHPWLSEDRTLYLSLALYSQFHCNKPVFRLDAGTLNGPWKQRSALFSQAAGILEMEVAKRIVDPYGGDGFEFVSADAPVVAWQELGYPLPPPPEKSPPAAARTAELPRNWTVMPSHPDGIPMVQFRFPPPLDNYAGEVGGVTGRVTFTDGLKFSGMTGGVSADLFTVTMGEADLDATLAGSLFLASATYPESEFVIDEVFGAGDAPEFGRLSNIHVKGRFRLKGKEIPLAFSADMEPGIGEDNKPLLFVRCAFSIDLRTFQVEGAQGPEPEKYTLRFDINLALAAGGEEALHHTP